MDRGVMIGAALIGASLCAAVLLIRSAAREAPPVCTSAPPAANQHAPAPVAPCPSDR